MATDEKLASTISKLVAEQCDVQVVALFAEFQKRLFTNVKSAVFNQLVERNVDLPAIDRKSTFSTIPYVPEQCIPVLGLSEKSAKFCKSVPDVHREEERDQDLKVSLKMPQEEEPQLLPRQTRYRAHLQILSDRESEHGDESKLSGSSNNSNHNNNKNRNNNNNNDVVAIDSISNSNQPPLLPSPLELSPEQEKFRREYRQFRNGEAFGAEGEFSVEHKQPQPAPLHKTTSLHPGLKSAFPKRLDAAKFHSRGLHGMEMARFKTLVPSPTPVPTPPTAPPKLPLAAVVPSEGVHSNPVQQTMSRAWADQNKSLARNASCNFDEVRIRIPGWLSLFGFQTSKCKCAMAMPLYTAAIFCFIGAAVAMQLVHLRDPGSMEGRFGNEVILVMGLCSAACLLQLNFRRPGQQSAVQVTSEMFTNNKMLPEYVDLWLERCRRSGREVLCLWFLSVATETAALLLKSDNLNPGTTAVHLVVFATVATWFSALSLYLLLVCCAQAAMVDHYSVTAAEQSRDYEVLRHRWDQIQAILRHSAQCLTPCLLILTLTPVIVVVTSIIELIMENEYDSQTILLELFPKAFWLLGIIRVLSKIGEVTGKCDRLPVFLNSLLLGDGFDEEGFRLLDFIERSKAGFYAFDAKVDYSVMSKVASVFSGGLLALLVKAV